MRAPLAIAAVLAAFVFVPSAAGHLLPRHAGEEPLNSQVRNLEHARELAARGPTTIGRARWHRIAERWLVRELGESWAGAVAVVRVYVGDPEADWLLSCSSSEGGSGAWVANRQGSGAGGWLQFMRGTFYRMIGPGVRIAFQYGLRVPPNRRTWYDPLGQAVAGVYGYRHSRGEWVGAGC